MSMTWKQVKDLIDGYLESVEKTENVEVNLILIAAFDTPETLDFEVMESGLRVE